MQLLVIILNKAEYLDELLEGFLELEIRGATVLDSQGMGSIITQDVPVFAGLKDLLKGGRPGNKTILSLVEDHQVELVVELFEDILGELTSAGNGIIFTLPVSSSFGTGTKGSSPEKK
jgi:nitrogen regulatory protein PII